VAECSIGLPEIDAALNAPVEKLTELAVWRIYQSKFFGVTFFRDTIIWLSCMLFVRAKLLCVSLCTEQKFLSINSHVI